MAKPPPVIVVVRVLVGLAQAHLGEWDPSLRRTFSGVLLRWMVTARAQVSSQKSRRPRRRSEATMSVRLVSAVKSAQVYRSRPSMTSSFSGLRLRSSMVTPCRRSMVRSLSQNGKRTCGAQGRLADSGHTNEDNVWAYPISYARHALSVNSHMQWRTAKAPTGRIPKNLTKSACCEGSTPNVARSSISGERHPGSRSSLRADSTVTYPLHAFSSAIRGSRSSDA